MPEVHAPDDIDGSEPGHAHGVAGMAGGEAACRAVPDNENSTIHGPVMALGQMVGAQIASAAEDSRCCAYQAFMSLECSCFKTMC